MDKTRLEQKIAKQAENRFNKEWQDLLDYLNKHPIAKRLKVKIGDTDLRFSINFRGGIPTNSLLDPYPSKSVTENTNYTELKDTLLAEYEDEELRNLLDKLSSVEYLFEMEQR